MISARIAYAETFYETVSALNESSSPGVTIPNNEIVAISRFRANGSDPDVYAMLIWDYGGGSEKIIASTKGDIDITFDTSNPDIQFTGNGSKKLIILLVNNGLSLSPVIGGSMEVTIVG